MHEPTALARRLRGADVLLLTREPRVSSRACASLSIASPRGRAAVGVEIARYESQSQQQVAWISAR